MTKQGELRAWYAANVAPAPSRFANDGRDYRVWAARADRYMAWHGDAEQVNGARQMTGELLSFADLEAEFAGWTRTRAAHLNVGVWKIAPDVTRWYVSITADGREFRVYELRDREAAFAWIEETCGAVQLEGIAE